MIKLIIVMAIFTFVYGAEEKPKIIFKIRCPKDKGLHDVITTEKPDEKFSLQCQESSQNTENTQVMRPNSFAPPPVLLPPHYQRQLPGNDKSKSCKLFMNF